MFMAFVGPKEFRYQAEKTFRKPAGVTEIKSFDDYQSFLAELSVTQDQLHSAYICMPKLDVAVLDIEAIKSQVQGYQPMALVYEFNSITT